MTQEGPPLPVVLEPHNILVALAAVLVLGIGAHWLAWRLRIPAILPLLVVGLLIVLLGVIGGLAYYSYATQRAHEVHIAALLKELEASRLAQVDLEQKTADERRRMSETLKAHEAETSQLIAMLQQQRRLGAPPEEIQALTKRLKTLEDARLNAEALVERYGPSVCLLYIAYGFVEKGGASIMPSVLLEYTGTGFLVDATGLIVTNRHLTEPWSMDPKGTAEMIDAGLEPRLVRLRAYFPGRSGPQELSVMKTSTQGDVALAQLSPVPSGIAPIPLRRPPPQAIAGEPLVVVGYPAGLEGLLARMDDKAAVELLKGAGRNLQKLVQDLADRSLIRPLTTQGHVSDAVLNRVIHDAKITIGGSGSPIFNSQGELIAVHSSIMTRFGAMGSGVPVARVVELLDSDR